MKKWIVYVFLLAFAAYWASNLILWYPWSYSSTLGMILMLTVTPTLWVYTTYRNLVTYPAPRSWGAVAAVSSIYLLIAVVFDFVFFGIMRGAMEQLLHPTTFYGYGFLIFWPIILFLVFRKSRGQQKIGRPELTYSTVTGLFCITAIAFIIFFDITL